MWVRWILAGVFMVGCGSGDQAGTAEPDAADWAALWAGSQVDTVGVRELAAADSVSGHQGLIVIESTVRFPREAVNAEVFAWEFQACALAPVKLIVVRYDRDGQRYELIGEGETRIPRQLGRNRFVLREPIPVSRGCMYGIYMPGDEAIPLRPIRNWRAMITVAGLQRPFMSRDAFATYGWQYAVRVFWRSGEGE